MALNDYNYAQKCKLNATFKLVVKTNILFYFGKYFVTVLFHKIVKNFSIDCIFILKNLFYPNNNIKLFTDHQLFL